MALGRSDGTRLDRFLAADDPKSALADWFGNDLAVIGNGRTLCAAIERDIAFLDAMLTDQLNRVLHHRRFLELEASWRGLHYLVTCAAGAENVLVRVLNAAWHELANDFDRANDIDQSALFTKVYSEEFGMPGGKPYGVLLCDYKVQHRTTPDHAVDDVSPLSGLAAVAAAAFAPAILNASPRLLGIDDFRELDHIQNLAGVFRPIEYARFNRLRDGEDARFLGLVLPRILLRKPRRRDGVSGLAFRYREDAAGLTADQLCWGGAVFAFGEVLIRNFHLHGWFADICGTRRDELDHGVVAGLTAPSAETDAPGVVPRFPSELAIPSHVEQDLWQCGLMTLNVCKDTPRLAFHSSVSIQAVSGSDLSPGGANARLSAMLRYILCVSRFAQYIKIKIRDRIGSYVTADACERDLQAWLHNYCLGNDDASAEMKARYPLREARVAVRPAQGRSSALSCVLHLRPHFQLDHVFTTFKLVTELALAPARMDP
ncbi:type VI secretion system contractile sheath large subunit [Aquabacter sp. L1I39]|uniref:type VI secretion system contractile sheath large subunit n=1 Tax=Aquabacter sp. L1I39 TaxID=2820278 RepID=UPI001ADCD50C|nr:type VI secretion system contractile sheath large subunit [Aquabacter sp. L1I39]QTL01702.1 type VI secretion system contractile sheath large subunit [Aquabacter sp. L1I39]